MRHLAFFAFLLSLPRFPADTETLRHVRSKPLWRSANSADFVTGLAPPENLSSGGRKMTGWPGLSEQRPLLCLTVATMTSETLQNHCNPVKKTRGTPQILNIPPIVRNQKAKQHAVALTSSSGMAIRTSTICQKQRAAGLRQQQAVGNRPLRFIPDKNWPPVPSNECLRPFVRNSEFQRASPLVWRLFEGQKKRERRVREGHVGREGRGAADWLCFSLLASPEVPSKGN